MLNYEYTLGNVPTLCSDCIEHLSVNIDCKFYFHYVALFFFAYHKIARVNSHRLLSVFHHRQLNVLYLVSVRSKLQYSSVAWNSITTADSNKLEQFCSLLPQ
jgi:hypothetical protein